MATVTDGAPQVSAGEPARSEALLNSVDIAVVVAYFGLVMATGLYVSMSVLVNVRQQGRRNRSKSGEILPRGGPPQRAPNPRGP